MSVTFWIDLLVALLIFLTAIVFVHQYKHGVIRDFRARRLRRKLVPRLQALLPIVIAKFDAEQPYLFQLFSLRADVESLVLQSSVLFDHERTALSEFMAMLSAVIAKYENGVATETNIEDVVLAGQRAIIELKEVGF